MRVPVAREKLGAEHNFALRSRWPTASNRGHEPSADRVALRIPVCQTPAAVTCRACRETSIVGAGIEVSVSAARAERIACDHVHAGDLDTCALTKPVGSIPAALRRKVWIRDKGQCVVPGCRSCRYLEVHHIIWREHGGWNCITNLVLLCDAHHAQLHDGLIVITGRAPDLVFETRVSPSWD